MSLGKKNTYDKSEVECHGDDTHHRNYDKSWSRLETFRNLETLLVFQIIYLTHSGNSPS